MTPHPIQILLVEDSPSDVRLTREAMRDAKVANDLHVARNGDEAMAFLRREDGFTDAPRPDLVLLDLNLPRKSGREVLAEVRSDPALRTIPVAVLTTSASEADVLASYELGANCYIVKPVEFNQFLKVIAAIDHFWLAVVQLPPAPS